MDKAKIYNRINDVVRMRTVLHPRDWKDESQLMMKRWFDYRFLSPVQATMTFAEHYIAGLRRYVSRNIDIALAEKVSVIKSGVPSTRAAWYTELWRARARTDEIFVPYDLLVDFSFDFASRRKRFWTMRPGQLHASERNREAWWSLFDERVEDVLPVRMKSVADIPHYRAENYLVLPAQDHFRELMMSEIRNEHRPLAHQIADSVFVKRHLTLEQGLALAPPDADLVELAKCAKTRADDRAWETRTVIKLDRADLLPSCFGIAETIDVNRAPCDVCPIVATCRTAAIEAINITVQATGSASPVLDADRKRISTNVANFRRKVSAAATTSSDH
ncbi:hypothetical protein GCM10010924_50540 [Rhizobium wenxiniae]|uniref:Uncharacterized protein n=1 Tax=Rhizobium wenxiniae TaxID=1737357 RepID=A0A7W9YBC5_9HYPH|nr:hypothetical protein [Rhizobium wenxiniae]MBB6165435.1 hypothetical protein [Rhizobium wenxiniae]GGG15383.1 hypothetical protein GCM10010924_50540 [Rhizobium wenxiniae]